MTLHDVQSLVLRPPQCHGVAHLILRVPEGRGCTAAALLSRLTPSFGTQPREQPGTQPALSIGFTHAGLEALGVPDSYLRVFGRRTRAYTLGAVRRSVLLGDGAESGAPNWRPEFAQDHAHVLLSWHGNPDAAKQHARRFTAHWLAAFRSLRRGRGAAPSTRPPVLHRLLEGEHLSAPPGRDGHWIHFGFRDGLSEINIERDRPPADKDEPPDRRDHALGALLLGEIDDAGSNLYALPTAPKKVREFFRHSSFGVLRKMEQNLEAFENQIGVWQTALAGQYSEPVSRDFVKAKLCGRWPSGEQLLPGDLVPTGGLVLDLKRDPHGQGCPFGSHVRRMHAPPDRNEPDHALVRPLQRRSMPYGPAAWNGPWNDGVKRGLLGHFFCASIEDQFEHLVGQWAARPLPGAAAGDRALDPLIGPHDEAGATLAVPLKHRPTQYLKGFAAWTTTLGTAYAWYPGKKGLNALLKDDFVSEEDEGPWL